MPSLPEPVARLVPSDHHLPLAFAAMLLVHVIAGLTCVVAGAVALTSPKRTGRHPKAGTVYHRGLAVIFVTAAGMSLLRWTTAPISPYDRLPSIAFWTVPSLVALPLLVRALRRHTRVWDDLRAMTANPQRCS